jgi:hypothetical protein
VDKILHCDCGFEARAEQEDELVAQVRRHAHEAHGMELTHDEARRLALRADPKENSPTTTPRETTARVEEEQR